MCIPEDIIAESADPPVYVTGTSGKNSGGDGVHLRLGVFPKHSQVIEMSFFF